MKTSPLGVLAAIVILGITVELVEQQSKTAAYTLVVIMLLGMITFNVKAFNQQFMILLSVFNAPARPKAPVKQQSSGGGTAGFH